MKTRRGQEGSHGQQREAEEKETPLCAARRYEAEERHPTRRPQTGGVEQHAPTHYEPSTRTDELAAAASGHTRSASAVRQGRQQEGQVTADQQPPEWEVHSRRALVPHQCRESGPEKVSTLLYWDGHSSRSVVVRIGIAEYCLLVEFDGVGGKSRREIPGVAVEVGSWKKVKCTLGSNGGTTSRQSYTIDD